MPRLTLKNKKSNDEKVLNLPQEIISIGRSSDCDVELADKSISRKHAQIMQEGEDYYLVDLKSGNGSFLNGKKIRPIEKQLLRSGDVIKIEDYEIQFSLLTELQNKPVQEDTDTDIVEVKMIRKLLGALSKEGSPSLEILNGSAEGKKLDYSDSMKELNIGRDPECELIIQDAVISRIHAKLIRKLGGIVLVDQESRNGCFVNNERIHEKLLRDGDKIMLGTIKILYRNPQDVNVDVISEEIARKKREAALREAEMMEVKKQSFTDSDSLNDEAVQVEEENAHLESQDSKTAESSNLETPSNEAEQVKAEKVELPPSIATNHNTNQAPTSVQKTDFILIGIGLFILVVSLALSLVFLLKD